VAGVNCYPDTVCQLSDSAFSNNSASAGPVVLLEAVRAASHVVNCSFSGNRVQASGVLSLYRVSGVHVNASTFAGNQARKSGGAIYTTDSVDILISNCSFLGNAAGTGAAVFAEALSQLLLVDCVFSGNRAVESAGALHLNDNSEAELLRCSLGDHYAVSGGAVVVTYASRLLFRSSVAFNNHALYNGWCMSIRVL
jgi:predicted outer membrane repeat protein